MEKAIIVVGLLSTLICSTAQVHGDTLVPLTLLKSAISKGAVCLDGSAPAYSYVEGSGNGSSSWMVYLEGGAWCYTLSDCQARSITPFGSSKFMKPYTNFSDIMDLNCTSYPDFCTWHKVYIHYCDGSSFMSDILHLKANLSFRGARIFNVMMQEMLGKGMGNAKEAMLVGSSAGGLATMLHCDKFRNLFPNTSRVKCISDSGFFLYGKDLHAHIIRKYYYGGVVKTHELANALPTTCTSKMDLNLCLFPEYFAGDIQTPLFILESAFDSFQVRYVVGFTSCVRLTTCNSTEIELMKDFRKTFIKTLFGLKNSSSRGMFVHSCYRHGHFPFSETSISLANKTIREAIADWYYDRSYSRELDTQHESPQDCSIHSFVPKPLNKHSLTSLPHNRLCFILCSFLLVFLVV
ncbi:[Wnt protein] O-palmitoleoyl-L-serine hydrolase [Salvia divinorum]|uniref:Pectin acetylesterase n=1 Tax=Salvia divinorum TaxID=28513 RepID=A0ABD1H794_SALDI